MPIRRKQDSKSPYYQWGESGAKYRYKSGNKRSRELALKKAKAQERAIYASGYRGK